MKQFYSLLLLFFVSLSYGQIPSNYYDSANGLSGYTLKTELKNIISTGHVARTYDQLYDGVGITGSNGYEDTHSDVSVSSGNIYENDGTILDFYSENPTGADPYNYTHGNNQCGNQMAEGDCYNREHIVPQSSFSSAFPMQSDIHHVVPTDGRVNNFRGSLPFGNVATPNFTSLNGSQRGTSAMTGYSGTVFEPIDEFKGDIARALLYFAVRYEDTVDGYTSFDMFNGSNDQVFFPWAIEVLLDWHNNVDPVDQRERDRNNAAYAFQNNANPFVDHPEYADLIWAPVLDTEAPSAPTNLMASNPTDNTIDLSWTASTDNIGVTSYDIYVDNVNSYNTTGTTFTVPGLSPDTNYCFNVVAKDAANNESSLSNQDCEMTTNSGTGGGMVDLFISEYVEGSGDNKAIEIANFTGSTVNVSTYSIARDTNGNGAWSTQLALTGTVANGDVYVITRTTADQDLIDESDLTVTNSAQAMLFNGDDPVGLFKNGVLIDVFGYFGEVGGSNTFSNATYRRKPSVEFPTTTFDLAGEWDMYPSNTFDNVGQHNQTLSTETFTLESITLYPNPVKNNRVTIRTDRALEVSIYNVLGKRVLKTNVNQNQSSIDVSSLSLGVYLVRLDSGQASTVKKLIKQ